MRPLVSTEWLDKNINNVRIFDASWHLPNNKRQAYEEYKKSHIKNSLFFDIDKNSNQKSSLPHMLTDKKNWEIILSKFGINNSDHIIIYDDSDIISSCRVWYNFLYFNHNPNLVSILDGGFKKWIKEKRKIIKEIKEFEQSNYHAKENILMVLNKNQIQSNIKNKSFELIDARSKERFLGKVPEPRKGLKSGNIEGSKNLPFSELIRKSDKTFMNRKELINIFTNHKIDTEEKLAFTCGSGVTACVLGLANSIISGKTPIVYDGSWSEWGKIDKDEKI